MVNQFQVKDDNGDVIFAVDTAGDVVTGGSKRGQQRAAVFYGSFHNEDLGGSMSFTKEELLGIVVMCRHESSLIDAIEGMIQGIKVHQARLVTATIASKADEMYVALEKAEQLEAMKKAEEKAE